MKQQNTAIKIYFNKKLFISGMILIAIFFGSWLVLLFVATDAFTAWSIRGEDILFFVLQLAVAFLVSFIMLYTGCNAHMIFTPSGVEYRQAFKKTELHSYREYFYVNKAFYMYYGMPMYYMVLSNRRLRNEEICQINNVRVSATMLKIRYNKKNYEALLSIVPSRIALSLQAQFKNIPPKRFNFCI